jgi:hypothetical protein
MDNEVQLQSRIFHTASRPRLTTQQRRLSDYEISCINLDRELGLVKPEPQAESIDIEDFIESPEEKELDDGTWNVRVRLVSVTRLRESTWYEIRVGRRHRFTYYSVKAAARAFNQLTAENLQPDGWSSSNGGQRATPAIPRAAGFLSALPRLLGWDLSASY